MQNYEKLGAFYLGKEFDLDKEERKDDLVLYDAKDLCTHAVCVGMTGSGKTGLCVGLLEEAAMDGVPAICIDPKGDLGNLMLTFPDLRASDFRPWIDESAALRKGKTPDEFAKSTAKLWRDGLAEWGQDGDRIRALREKCEVLIYTPGNSAGRQVTVLKALNAPPPAMLADHDAMRERIAGAVAGLVALLGLDGDPMSRESILLATILDTAWRAGRDVKLGDIIGQIQNPPFDKVGFFDLETFFPAKDRLKLALQLNGLLASPGFSAWMRGEPLDIGDILYTPEGKPRIAIMSIAHLSDAERMFFVTILLNEMLAWMRSQPGTSSLRALLYMDEIFGYFPPTANPPSKQPMLTMLKQARAFGLGVVMATQNPVDLDYKGLSNCGTWFIGRLQTERDKLRVLDGLESASAETGGGFERGEMDRILSSVGKRRFLLHNVHEDGPVIFETRWVMSYLRGPMTRQQIEVLMADRKAAAPPPLPPSMRAGAEATAAAQPAPAAAAQPEPDAPSKPMLGAGIDEFHLPVEGRPDRDSKLVYRPVLAANVRVHFSSRTDKVDQYMDARVLATIGRKGRVDWGEADLRLGEWAELLTEPDRPGVYGDLEPEAANSKYFTAWKKELISHLYQNATLTLHKCADLKLVSQPGETEGAFRGRIAHLAREERDLAVEKLRDKYASKLATLEDRVRRAEARIEKEEEEYRSAKMSSMVSIGSTIVGALFGRKKLSVTNIGRAGSSMRSVGSASKQKGDIARAEDELQAQQEKLLEMELELEEEIAELEREFEPENLDLEEVSVRCLKTHTTVNEFGLAWTPWEVDRTGIAQPLFE